MSRSKSPGVPARRRWSPPRSTRGMPVIGELELAWRLLPNRFVAVTGTNGKTTVDRAARPHLAHRRRAGRRRRQRRHAARLARGRARPRRDRDLRVLELPARGHRGVRSRVRGAAQRHAPTTSTATAPSSTTSTRSCGSSPTRATDAAIVDPLRPLRASPARACPATPAEIDARARRPRRSSPSELGLLGPHNLANARVRRRGGSRDGDRERGDRRARLRELRGRAAPARAGRRDRRGRLRERLEGDQRRRRRGRAALVPSTAASTRSWAARSRAGTSPGSPRRSPSAARRLSDRRGRPRLAEDLAR